MKTVVWCTRVRQLMDHWNHTRKAIWNFSISSQPPPPTKTNSSKLLSSNRWFQHPPPKSYQLSSYPNPPSKTPKPPGNVPTPQRRKAMVGKVSSRIFFSVRAVLEKLAHPLRCSHGPHLRYGDKNPWFQPNHISSCVFSQVKKFSKKNPTTISMEFSWEQKLAFSMTLTNQYLQKLIRIDSGSPPPLELVRTCSARLWKMTCSMTSATSK